MTEPAQLPGDGIGKCLSTGEAEKTESTQKYIHKSILPDLC